MSHITSGERELRAIVAALLIRQLESHRATP